MPDGGPSVVECTRQVCQNRPDEAHMTSRRAAVLAVCLYTAITLGLTYPLVLHLATIVPSDLGDPLLNAWILWWNSQAAPLTAAWWNAPAFFPAPDTLVLSEHLFGLSLFTTPVILISGNAQLAYNLAFLLTFVLSATGAYALGFTLTKRHDAAFLAGLVYGFAPYRMAQFPHIQVLASFWMPLALVGLHKYVEDRRPRWLALFGGAVLLQGLTNGYYLLFFPILLGLWLLWFLPRDRRVATLAAIGGTFVAASLPIVPFLLHYRDVHERFGLRRGVDEMAHFSVDLTDFVHAFGSLSIWGRLLPSPGPEAEIFPGLTVVLLLIVAGFVWGRTRRPEDVPVRPLAPRAVRVPLAALAGLFTLVALSVIVLGPWRFEVAGLLVSAQRLSRPVTQATYLWLLVILSGTALRRLFRAESPLVFYVAATLVVWILSLGPSPTLDGERVLYWAPYRWLTLLPGYSGLRVPARFAMLAMLCLAAAGGLALARLLPRLGRRGQIALVAAASIGVLADGWRLMPLERPPAPSILTAAAAAGAVLELPMGEVSYDVTAMYRGMAHRHPIVNGYSGYSPPHYDPMVLAVRQEDESVFTGLASLGLRHVVLNTGSDPDDTWRAYIERHPDLRFVREADGQRLYEITESAAAAMAAPGPSLPIAGATASRWPDDVANMLDGKLETRWSTRGPQGPGDWVRIDLGGPREVGGVVLDLGPFRADFPRALVVEGSLDGEAWTELWRGHTGGLRVAGAFTDATRNPVRVPLAPAAWRYLRLQQVGQDLEFYWSIAELSVTGSPRTG